MDRWSLAGALVFGAVFALFAFFRVEAMNEGAIRMLLVCFVFASYCALVAISTFEKRRKLSLFAQTALGVAASLAIAAILDASTEAYAAAGVVGLILGFTADFWVVHLRMP
jgi:hypothetical protein